MNISTMSAWSMSHCYFAQSHVARLVVIKGYKRGQWVNGIAWNRRLRRSFKIAASKFDGFVFPS